MQKNKIVLIISCIVIVMIMFGFLGLNYFSYESKEYIVQDGVKISMSLDGSPIYQMPTTLPGNSQKKFHADISCDNNTVGRYEPVRVKQNSGDVADIYEMRLTFSTSAANGKCSVDFKTVDTNTFSSYDLRNIISSDSNVKEVVTGSGLRYTSKNPKNWIWFNNELWRIIGVIPACISASNVSSTGATGTCVSRSNLIKIIKADDIGAWGFDAYSSGQYTYWGTGTSLFELLNSYYLGRKIIDFSSNSSSPCLMYSGVYGSCDFSSIGISIHGDDYYHKMMKAVFFDSGVVVNDSTNTMSTIYSNEGTAVSAQSYVGIMNLSDYNYAASGISLTASVANGSSYEQNNWLFQGHYNEWTMTPVSSAKTSAYYISYQGGASTGTVAYTRSIRPTVFMDGQIYVVSGNGSQKTPYMIDILS